MSDELTPQGRFAEIAREDGRAAVVTMLEGPGAGAKVLFEPDGSRRGSLGSPELDDEAARHADELMWSERSEQRGNLFVDVTYPAPRLIVFGAIDFAAQLCTLARTSGWRPYVVDQERKKDTNRDAHKKIHQLYISSVTKTRAIREENEKKEK